MLSLERYLPAGAQALQGQAGISDEFLSAAFPAFWDPAHCGIQTAGLS